jgi:hypothetical protein
MAGATQLKDMTGREFGYLTVIRRDGTYRNTTQAAWLCRCRCGTTTSVCGNSLRSGRSRSCGCLIREVAITFNTTHGKTGSRAYNVWGGMLQRCLNPNNAAWSDYGGRGITVCKRWLTFENFYADMGDPLEGLTLDRFPNNDGNYEPGNCRWATRKEQAINQRRRLSKTFQTTKGPLTINEIMAETGLTHASVTYRIKSGFSPEQMLLPANKMRRSMTSSTVAPVGASRFSTPKTAR